MEITHNRHVDNRRPFFNVRNKYVEDLEIDLLLFGDSITEGFDINRYYPTNKVILNSGIGGERLDSAYARIEDDVININPKKVLFNLGINDFIHYEEYTLEDYELKINTLFNLYKGYVNQIRNKGIEVVCSSIIKLGELPYDEQKNKFRNFPYQNEHINILNEMIYDFCEKEDILYVDYNIALENKYGFLKGCYTYDNIHLNEKGYFEITKLLIEAGVL